MGKIEYTDLGEAEVVTTTAAAIRFSLESGDEAWIPMSQIRTDVLAECHEGATVGLRVQTWWIEKEDLL